MGLTAARRLYTPDAPMVLVDLNADGVRAVAAELGGNVHAVACDVSDPESVAALADGRRSRRASLARPRGRHLADDGRLAAHHRSRPRRYRAAGALLEPQTSPGSAAVCWASIAGHGVVPDDILDAALDDPLAPDLMDRLGAIAGDGLAAAGRVTDTRNAG